MALLAGCWQWQIIRQPVWQIWRLVEYLYLVENADAEQTDTVVGTEVVVPVVPVDTDHATVNYTLKSDIIIIVHLTETHLLHIIHTRLYRQFRNTTLVCIQPN